MPTNQIGSHLMGETHSSNPERRMRNLTLARNRMKDVATRVATNTRRPVSETEFADAVNLLAGWLGVAAEYHVTLADLDHVTDLPEAAYMAVRHASRRERSQ